ncbi:Eco57I restriction-modification methylase domain-containing protein [Methanocella sp. MCL-LM]|uniref:Eco57I restriction-modification methylase domain-containing protein n=1 Tax=Methanocella sp. MCL-LM TaxID=3412035 RepID=UPI003C72F26D
MEANQRKILKAICLEIRHILEGRFEGDRFIIGDLERRLNEIGVWRDRTSKKVEELPHLSSYDKDARRIIDAYIHYREEAGVKKDEAVAEFIRESAYTWSNRLLALRCMESRAIIDEVIVQKEIYGGRSLIHNRFVKKNYSACSGDDDGLYSVLFNEFTAHSKELPEIFDPNALAVSLRPSIAAIKRIIDLLSGKIVITSNEMATDDVFIAQDTLGWAYQYWNAEEKERVFKMVRINKGAKIEGRDIIPATQLYTEPYMVKYLVQNSLGAIWMQIHPESKLFEQWEFFVRDANREIIEKKPISEITFIDPACGSGHFLLEAFDLLYNMYIEESNLKNSEEICRNILNNNLFGIEIDERAAQITKLVLWMRAKEKAIGFYISSNEPFHKHILATNIQLPSGKDHLDIYLVKHPEDLIYKSTIESVFEGLNNVNELGSLLQIEELVDKELKYLAKDAKQKIFSINSGTLITTQTFEKIKNDIISRLIDHFDVEAKNPDLSQTFFSNSAGKGLALFNLLDKRYDIVATNPPYMGLGNMGEALKKYINKHYNSGKNDLYSAFILRCIQLANNHGQIAMVTQQSWMFLKSFIELRCGKCSSNNQEHLNGILCVTCVETIAHLGTRAFNEISGEVVNIVLFNLSKRNLSSNHEIIIYRLVAYGGPHEKTKMLLKLINCSENNLKYHINQKLILSIKDAPLSLYCLPHDLIPALKMHRFGDFGDVSQGPSPNVNKHVRFWWEIPRSYNNWVWYVKGGGYGKWAGKELWVARWPIFSIDPKSTVRGEKNFGKGGLCYTTVAQGNLSVRRLKSDTIFSDASSGIFAPTNVLNSIYVEWNSRLYTYYARMLCGKLDFSENYLRDLPSPILDDASSTLIGTFTQNYKLKLLQYDLLEREFYYNKVQFNSLVEDLLKYFALCAFYIY